MGDGSYAEAHYQATLKIGVDEMKPTLLIVDSGMPRGRSGGRSAGRTHNRGNIKLSPVLPLPPILLAVSFSLIS